MHRHPPPILHRAPAPTRGTSFHNGGRSTTAFSWGRRPSFQRQQPPAARAWVQQGAAPPPASAIVAGRRQQLASSSSSRGRAARNTAHSRPEQPLHSRHPSDTSSPTLRCALQLLRSSRAHRPPRREPAATQIGPRAARTAPAAAPRLRLRKPPCRAAHHRRRGRPTPQGRRPGFLLLPSGGAPHGPASPTATSTGPPHLLRR